VTRAPAAVGKPNCDDKFRPGVYRVGTFDQRRDAAAGRKGTAQRALTATPDPFSPGSTRKGSAEPIQKEENRAAARFLKPSAGLEPATPSGPSKSGRVVRRGSESQSPCVRSEIWCQHPAASIGTFRHPPVPREYLDRRGVDAERRGVAPSSARCAARGRVHGRHPLIAASKSPDRRALRGGSGDVGCRARGRSSAACRAASVPGRWSLGEAGSVALTDAEFAEQSSRMLSCGSRSSVKSLLTELSSTTGLSPGKETHKRRPALSPPEGFRA
jgi:hypothetical protein